jgi:Mg2+ and Co2+ transporter CorA
MIQSFHYLPGEGVKTIEGVADFDRLSAVANSVLWVDLCKPSDQESYVLTHDFKFHPLAIEDVISEKPRTKVDDYDRYLFSVVTALSPFTTMNTAYSTTCITVPSGTRD